MSSVRVLAEAPPPKSGFSQKSGFRFRRSVQQTGAFLQTSLSMERYCAISFQRPLYEPLIRIFRRPVMVLRVSLLSRQLTFIPVSPKCFTFATTTWSWFESKIGTPPAGPPGAPQCAQNLKNLEIFDFHHVPPKWPDGPQIFSIASRKHFF